MENRRRSKVHASKQDEIEAARDVHNQDNDRPWEPPSHLNAPPPQPGMSQKWIRHTLRGDDDNHNLMKAFQQGWKPRRADTVPADFYPPTIKHGEFAGCIGAPGLILCEMPTERVEKRNAYYRGVTERNTRAITEDLTKVQQPGMPISQSRQSNTTVGRRPMVAPDE